MKESLWTAGVVALVAHGLMISAFALTMKAWGMACFKGGAQPALTDHFVAEMVFVKEKNKNGRETRRHPSPAASRRPLPQGERYEHPMPSISPTPRRNRREAAGEGAQAHPCPVYNPPPVYPLEARRRKMQGVVLVRLSLTETGEVSHATPLPPRVGSVLEEAALAAIRKWRFKPVARTVEIPIEFRLVD